MSRTIPLSQPDIAPDDIAAVTDVLRSGHLSLGPQLPAFEEEFAAYAGTKYAVAANSGTSALHLCVRALGVGPGDEVITTPFSFVASSNCMLFEGATPVFVDIEPETYCIDPAKIEAAITPKTKAILPVDVFGYLADYSAIASIAASHNLAIIEDSCEALGTERSGKKAGAYGDAGVFGFYPNKQMTTGEGGMITTDREDIAMTARSMRNQGRSLTSQFLEHEQLGYNFRLSDINCALGRSQLGRIDALIRKRQDVRAEYNRQLTVLSEHLTVPPEQKNTNVSPFVYVVTLHDRYSADDRDAILTALEERGIGCRNYFPCIHLQPLYKKQFGYKEGDFPASESIAERTIALPFHSNLPSEDIEYVCSSMRDILKRL